MEIISTVGLTLFMVSLILNIVIIHVNFKDLKKNIILDEILLLTVILGMNFWMVASVSQKFETGGYDGVIIMSVTIFISFSVSRISVLTGEKKQIIKEMMRANKKEKGD